MSVSSAQHYSSHCVCMGMCVPVDMCAKGVIEVKRQRQINSGFCLQGNYTLVEEGNTIKSKVNAIAENGSHSVELLRER